MCGHDECEKILHKFYGYIPRVLADPVDFEWKLDELKDDLEGKYLEEILTQGRCTECPG